MTMPAQPIAPAAATAPGPSAANVQAPVVNAPVEKPNASQRRAARAAALKTELAKAPDDAGGETTTQQTTTQTTAAPTTTAGTTTADANVGAAVTDPLAKAREERLARIAQMRAREESDDAKRSQHSASKEQTAEIERLRKRVSELEPHAQKFKSPAELLAYAEAEGMSAEEVVKFLRERMTNPEAIAKREAKTEADKLRDENAALRKEFEDLKKSLDDRDAQAKTGAERQQMAMNFLSQTESKRDTHPLTAAFLARHGAQGYIGYANQFVAPVLREDYSLEELHDSFEQLLDELQLGSSATGAASSASPANGASQPAPKNGAAKPATTLSSAIASERTTVAEETPLHRLPREERKRRLKERLERE